MTQTTTHPIAQVRIPPNSVSHFFTGIWIVCQRELIKWTKDRGRLVAGLVQPLLWLFVMGVGLSHVVSTPGGFHYQTFLFPGIVSISVLFTAIFSGVSLVWDREFGFLREMLVAPVNRGAIILGKCLGGAITATVQGIIMLALAGFVHVPYSVPLFAEMIGMIFLISFSVTAFGLMLAVRVKQIQTVMPLVQLFITPMMFLSGAMYPLGDLPLWLQFLTRINPLTYAIQPMRSAVFHHIDVTPAAQHIFNPDITWNGWPVPVWLQLLMVIVMSAVMLAVTIFRFRKVD
jgi:ABC-2 type transport system permease protein